MAIAFVQDFYAEGGASTIVLTVPAGGIAAGNTLILYVFKDTTPHIVSSIADASGGTNTYAEIVAVTGPTSTDTRAFLWYAPMTAGLSAASSITVTLSGASGGACIASEFSGLDSSPLDQFTGQQTSTTAGTSGLTATTTVADELVFGTYGIQNTSAWTPDGTYTLGESRSPFSAWRMITQYKIVSAMDEYESNGTIGTGGVGCNMVATLKQAGPVGVQNELAWIRA